MAIFNPIFDDAENVYVRKQVIYGNATDSKLYKNLVGTTYSNQLEEAELVDLFTKGMLLIKVGDVFFNPVGLEDNKVTTVSLVSTTVTITEWAAKAAE